MADRLLLERDGPVLTVRFDRPPRHFFDERTGVELDRLTRRIDRDRTVRAVVFTGSGDSFVTHMDVPLLLRGARSAPRPVPYPAARVVTALADALSRVPAIDPLLGRGTAHDLVTAARVRATFTRLTRSDVVTVAALNGLTLGMGCILALACDLRLIADHAEIGLPESALGVLAASGGTQRLVHTVGAGRALDLLLSARWLPADEAVAIGLAHRAVPGDRLMTDATDLAHRLAERPPAVVREIKRMVHDGGTRPLRRALAMESASLATTMSSTQTAPLLAAYDAWLDAHPDLTDDQIRGGWPAAPDAFR